jgi:hypothetical protein
MFDWIKGFFKKPDNKLVLTRKGPLTEDEISKEKHHILEENIRERKERIRNNIKEKEKERCYCRPEERNHYFREAVFHGGHLRIECEFCESTAHAGYYGYALDSNSSYDWLSDVLAEEGFE